MPIREFWLRRPPRYGGPIVDRRKALLIGLAVLLVLIGVPVLMPGMNGATCHDCGPMLDGGVACSVCAVLISSVGIALVVALASGARRIRVAALMRVFDLERPPQMA